MSSVEDIRAACAKIRKMGETPDMLIISPQMFDPRKPYHGGGTNRSRKQRRFRSVKRVQFFRRALKEAEAANAS